MNFQKNIAVAVLALSLLPQPCLAAVYPFEELEISTLPRLEKKLLLCEEKGISTQYERINVQTIRDFISYGKDILNIEPRKGRNVLENLEKLADEAEESLNQYLNGGRMPQEVPEFLGGAVSFDGYTIVGETDEGQRPVFLNGYNNAASDIEKINQYGVNLIQTEMGPHSYFLTPSTAKWKYSGAWSRDCRFWVNNDEFYSGNACLQIQNSNGGEMTLIQDISLPAGNYVLKFYAKGSGVSGGGVQYGTPDNVTTVKAFNPIGGTWKAYTYNFNLRSAQTVRIGIDATASIENLMIDELSLKSANTEYMTHGDFDTNFSYQVSKNDPNRGIGADYAVSAQRYLEQIEPTFDKAAANHIKIDFIISPHYFPSFLKSQGAEVSWKSAYNTFLNFDIYSELAKSTIEEYLKCILPEISQKEALMSICITNEPKYQIANIDGFFDKHPEIKAKWVDYLTNRYGTIGKLNTAHNKAYTNFNQVEMSLSAGTAQYYDTVTFNAMTLSDWHTWLAGLVRQYAPGVPIHTKQMNHIANGDGMHPERAVLGGYADLGGNDAYNLYVTATDNLSNKLFWYDFVGSFAKVPVFNSENHIIVDTGSGTTPYLPEVAQYVSADLWQGAIHGRSASVLWAWEKSFNKSNIFYDSLGSRPDAVAAAGRTTLDLNRLATVVAEFQNAEPELGILYSEASAIYESAYRGNLLSLYKSLNESGKKVTFVSENQIQANCHLKMLVVPKYTNYTNEATVTALNDYMENGGRVLTWQGNFLYNTKKFAQEEELSQQSVVIPQNDDIAVYLTENLEMLGMDSVVLNEGSVRASGVDWKYVTKNGKTWVNLCNETNAEKILSLTIDGGTKDCATNLITGETVNTAKIFLMPYTPVMLELDGGSFLPVGGFLAETETESVVLSWLNGNNSSNKQIYVLDEKDSPVFEKTLTGTAEQLTVPGLTPGSRYTAVITEGNQSKSLSFTTKRLKKTDTYIKGWGLDYRSGDAYTFDDGEFSIVSNEKHSGNSSLKLTLHNPRQAYVYYQLCRDITLQKGTTYRYTIWYKTEGYGIENKAKSRFTFYANDREYPFEEVIKTADGVWEKEEGSWHSAIFEFTPTSTKNYRWSLIVDSGGTIWLDDLSVYATSGGAITGNNLLGKTSAKVGGDFEDDSYSVVPLPLSEVDSEFMGQKELLLSWIMPDGAKRVNIYREEAGEMVLVSTTEKNTKSVLSFPYSSWHYFLTTVDAYENESETITVSGKNMGNVSPVTFYLNGQETKFLQAGNLSAEGYAYEEGELILALYEKGRLISVNKAAGSGYLKAELQIDDNPEDKQAAAFFWQRTKPLKTKTELLPQKK